MQNSSFSISLSAKGCCILQQYARRLPPPPAPEANIALPLPFSSCRVPPEEDKTHLAVAVVPVRHLEELVVLVDGQKYLRFGRRQQLPHHVVVSRPGQILPRTPKTRHDEKTKKNVHAKTGTTTSERLRVNSSTVSERYHTGNV